MVTSEPGHPQVDVLHGWVVEDLPDAIRLEHERPVEEGHLVRGRVRVRGRAIEEGHLVRVRVRVRPIAEG